jgi:hypothetical protein
MAGLVLRLLVTRMVVAQTEGMEATQTVAMLTVKTTDNKSSEPTLAPRHYQIRPRLARGIRW